VHFQKRFFNTHRRQILMRTQCLAKIFVGRLSMMAFLYLSKSYTSLKKPVT
jgi:hypothetical protein